MDGGSKKRETFAAPEDLAIHLKLGDRGGTAMIEKTLDITTKDGAMETFICHPERNGPSPAAFFLMDASRIFSRGRHPRAARG